MSAILKTRMVVDEFLAWAEVQPGRHELIDGTVVSMSPERLLHVETKGEVFAALRDSVRAAGRDCRVLTDGATVRIDENTAYEPDALVYCGPRLARSALECPDPVIVVEVLSPGTAYRDLSLKLTGYLGLPSVAHYLVVDPDRGLVTHHRRGADGHIVVGQHREGALRLDPPGITVEVRAMLPLPGS